MTQPLKEYKYTPAESTFTETLKGLATTDLDDKLTQALSAGNAEQTLAGFHFLIQSLVAARLEEDSSPVSKIDAAFFDPVMALMKEKGQFFGYSTGNEFFQIVDEASPIIFFHNSAILPAMVKNFPMQRSGEKNEITIPAAFGPELISQIEQLTQRCATAFKDIRFIIPVMQRAYRVRERYKRGDATITPADVKQAKDDFDKHKGDYQKFAKIISQGMPFIHKAIAAFPKELVVHQVYNRYLAQLLVSQEVKGSVEVYVFKVADQDFDTTEPDFTLNEDEKLREVTVEKKREDYRALLQLDTNRLEARYRKRKLMTMLQGGMPKYKILSELVKVSETDPGDIKTHILAARLIAEHSQAITNTAKRVQFREQALNHCKKAFAKIDDYLNLQGIDNLRERDKVRVGFVKTISGIRNPLIRGK